jgi:hypothetical protein
MCNWDGGPIAIGSNRLPRGILVLNWSAPLVTTCFESVFERPLF